MERYILYNADREVAKFLFDGALVTAYIPVVPELLPMQIRNATADGFMAWIHDRAIDLNTVLHRNMVSNLLGSRDKIVLALMTHMFSISDTFTCFREGEFIPRRSICLPDDQACIAQYILVSSDTSLRGLKVATPNVSTDGSFPKTWKYENNEWWLYKIQSAAATRCEVEISRVLQKCGWAAAEYAYDGRYRKHVKCRNFVGADEFFEPYDSFRFCFDDKSDDDETVLGNFSSLGASFETDWKRILLADAFFLNTDRHMRNFGVIRSSETGKVLRLAPNFDNNQAYTANPGGRYSDSMLKAYPKDADMQTRADLRLLIETTRENVFLKEAAQAAEKLL